MALLVNLKNQTFCDYIWSALFSAPLNKEEFVVFQLSAAIHSTLDCRLYDRCETMTTNHYQSLFSPTVCLQSTRYAIFPIKRLAA